MLRFNLKLYFFVILWMIIFSSCAETLISVNIYPDGKYTMDFITKGDSSDVFNDDFSHPFGAGWFTTIKTDIQDENKIWIMKTEGFKKGAILFTPYADSLTALQHPIHVSRQTHYFSTKYTLYQVFHGRQVYRKYPSFGKSLQESDGDSTRWLDEAFTYMCSQGIKDLQAIPETAIAIDLAERIHQHIRNTLQHIDQKDLFEELENKQKFINQMLSPFRENLPLGYSKTLSNATDIYEEEIDLTTELQDDRFRMQVTMPGMITSTNADTIFGDTLKWEFGLQDYVNDDYVIEAASVIYLTKRIQKAILIVASLCLTILFLIYRRRP